jgi:hypothetical protein
MTGGVCASEIVTERGAFGWRWWGSGAGDAWATPQARERKDVTARIIGGFIRPLWS